MMSSVLLLLPHLLAFSQSAPEPDTHLHVHVPPETGGQGETPNTGAGGLAADGLNARIGGYDYANDALKAKKGRDGNRAPSGKDKDEIHGGTFASSAIDFPFLAAFYYNSTNWTGRCAGALISPRHVITSWHCFQDKVSKLTQVEFYKRGRGSDVFTTIKRQVRRFVFHPTLDVAILVLERGMYEIGLRLPAADDGCDYNGQIITVVGPGDADRFDTEKSLFMKVDLKAYSGNRTSPNTGKKCINREGREFVCATSLKKENWGSGGPGDSGAPMMICRDKEGRDCTLVGILTGGTVANFATDFNFKSDSVGPCVSALRPWIDVVIKETVGEKWSLGGKDDDDNDNDDNDDNEDD